MDKRGVLSLPTSSYDRPIDGERELLNHQHTSLGFVVDSFNGYLYLSFPTFNNKSTVIQPQID